MRRALTIGLIVAALVALACGPGGAAKDDPKDPGNKLTIRHGCSGPGDRGGAGKGGNGKADGPDELWFVAVVCTTRLNDEGTYRPFTKRVNVIITAHDQWGIPGLWIDTPQNGPPVPRPYPKDTNEVTPYRHPIFFGPGLVITASVTATLLGKRNEFIECWFEDMTGAEMTGTYSQAKVSRINDLARVHCAATVGE